MIKEIELAKQFINEADALLITAGAGMGVDSGLPDFRGNEGFWKAYPAIKNKGLSFEDMANPYWFESDPELAWAFYGHRLHLYRNTRPHEGFELLLKLMDKKPGYSFVVTSNVDGQFQKAGFDEKYIWEKHGSIHNLQCTKESCSSLWPAKDTDVLIDVEQFKAVGGLPHCPECGALARPNILMFNDLDWNNKKEERQKRHYLTWKKNIVEQNMKVAVIEIGAGTALRTIRMFTESLGQRELFNHIRINPTESQGPLGTISLPLGALEALTRVT